jgi:hypothetical protein
MNIEKGVLRLLSFMALCGILLNLWTLINSPTQNLAETAIDCFYWLCSLGILYLFYRGLRWIVNGFLSKA